jgi:hypothetical protein
MTGVGLTFAAVPSASADGPVITPCAERTICTSDHQTTTLPGSSGSTSGGGGGGGSSACTWQGHEVPCWIDNRGAFSAGCYYIEASPQPLATESVWGTHTSKDGRIYDKSCILNDGFVPAGQVFLAQPVAARPPKSPREVARDALTTITVGEPVLRAAPAADAVVGSPVWLWVEPDRNVLGPLSSPPLHDEGGGPTVVTTITLQKVSWTVDDGPDPDAPLQHFDCKDGGTVFNKTGTPTCSHLFTRSSARMKAKAYSLSVRFDWQVTARTTDGVPIDMTGISWSTTGSQVLSVPVNEVQVLN